MKKVNILGTEYRVEEHGKEDPRIAGGIDGYCDTSVKLCVVDCMDESGPNEKEDLKYYQKSVMRHELIHAALFESGLESNSWAANEEMVDWMAIQFPKLLKIFEEVECL